MYSFQNFISISEELLLTEALNNPVEYYMTDDTKMPDGIFAAFDIDGGKYIMNLVQSDNQGVYLFDVGRAAASVGKTLWWRFHNKSDILPVMATAMHFLQASTMWMQGKVKGIAIQFRMGAEAASKAQRIAEKIIKRAYVKSFEVIPVSQPPVTDQDKYFYQKIRYVFIAKKGVSRSALFGGKTFKRYDIEAGTAPIEAVSQLKPKKEKKATNTLKPSSKYSFGQFEVDTPADQQLLDKLAKIEVVAEPAPQSKTNDSDEHKKMLDEASGGGLNALSGMIQALNPFNSMVSALKKHGFDEKKLNWSDLKYVVNNMSTPEKELLQNAKLIPIEDNKKALWESVMKKIAKPSPLQSMKVIVTAATKDTKAFIKKFPNGSPSGSVAAPSGAKTIKSNINPNDLQPTLPGSGTDVSISYGVFVVSGEDPTKKANHLFYDLGYDKITSITGFSNLNSYTGSEYNNYNNPIRNIVSKLLEGQPLTKQEIDGIIKGTNKYQKLAKMFELIQPLPESLWVYRGTTLPGKLRQQIQPGYQFVDPAFLSTSVNPDTGMGSDRMRIFLPKGSKVLPVLFSSQHPSEKEILLPPTSVIKVIETHTTPQDSVLFQGVYMGSSWKSITAALKKKLNESTNYDIIKVILEKLIMEQEETEKYDPSEKFGGEYNDELAELINNEIEKGTFKIEGPEQSED